MKTKLSFIALAVMVIIGWQFFDSFRASRWHDGQVNFVLSTGESTAIASLSANENQLNFLLLPGRLYFSLPGELGDYRLDSIYELGEIKREEGGVLLMASLQNLLGIPVEGFIRIEDFGRFETGSLAEADYLSSFFWQALIKKRKRTNFSFWDLIRLVLAVKKTGSLEFNFVDLEKTDILAERELADKSKVLEAEEEKLDVLIKRLFSERKIEEEGIEVGILNSTGHPGLARNLARMIENMGGRVIHLGNVKQPFSTSVIHYQEGEVEKSETMKRLMAATGFDSAKVADLGESRGEIEIIIGEDYWEKTQAGVD